MASVYKVCPVVTAHAWNGDRTQVALCPNNEDIHIYDNCKDSDVKNWKRIHVLKGHDLVVSGIDWHPVTNQIVSCSHDRNAFVWKLNEDGTEWKPSLSILRINRAALQVRWSPDGKKFAVASGAKVVPVCHYEEANDWWVSKMIKKHKSTVIDVCWHPNSTLLATASSDFKCRVFCAAVEGDVLPTESPLGDLSQSLFGELLQDFDDASGWVEAVTWSPSGNILAFAGHDSSISFVDFNSGSTQTLKGRDLPYTSLYFASEDVLIAAGHNFNPGLYQTDSSGNWSFVERVDVKETKTAASSNKSGFNAARNMWASKVNRGQNSNKNDGKSKLWTKHVNCINCIRPYSSDKFSTSGLDGKIVVWNTSSLASRFAGLKL